MYEYITIDTQTKVWSFNNLDRKTLNIRASHGETLEWNCVLAAMYNERSTTAMSRHLSTNQKRNKEHHQPITPRHLYTTEPPPSSSRDALCNPDLLRIPVNRRDIATRSDQTLPIRYPRKGPIPIQLRHACLLPNKEKKKSKRERERRKKKRCSRSQNNTCSLARSQCIHTHLAMAPYNQPTPGVTNQPT